MITPRPPTRRARVPAIPYRTVDVEPLVFARCEEGSSEFALPERDRPCVIIDAIHDGDVIPGEFLVDGDGRSIGEETYVHHYAIERDWGASLVADALARNLGLTGHYKVELARVVMDFGRFPGITPKDCDHLGRRAINYPFSGLLNHEQKRRILAHYYDRISEGLEQAVACAEVKIAIHTYDTHNASGTLRPPVSVLTRCVGYQVRSEMPLGVFDPLFPDLLGEFTADRILRDRISLTLERAGISTEHNYPYLLPDGSVEVRSQVWNFFRMLREAYEREYLATRDDPAHQRVWRMLLDTNLRSSASEALRSYLHAFRRVTPGRELEFVAAREAYDRIAAFLHRDDGGFLREYRHSRSRPSAIGVEVRKDLIYEFDADGYPVAPRPGGADEIAAVLARAVHTYFTLDRHDRRSQPRW